ncbi:MAG: hypothetical protein ACKVPX_01535 [Myxococcaceae bacterium]
MFKWLLWSLLCFGLGIAMATVRVGRETPWRMLQKAARTQTSPEKLREAQATMHEAVSGLRAALASDKQPSESHSATDREAVRQLVAQRRQR